MDKFVVKGGQKLQGKLKVSGAKNAALPNMIATLLAPGTYNLSNVPNLRDIWTMARLLDAMGVFCELNGSNLFVDSTNINSYEAPYEHVKKMRASVYVLGPLLGRYGEAKVSLPGGCAWGPRPIDLHLKGMEKLGANIEIEKGYVIAKAKRLKGAKIHFDVTSVGATGNVMMAASLAKGTTVLSNAAIEPEITALARLLVKMGAKIEGIGSNELIIEGVEELKPTDDEVIPDRIEAATFLIAAAMTGGKIVLERANPYHLTSVISKLEESGCDIDFNGETITLEAPDEIQPVDIITAPYPGFPTDVQAQWIAYMLKANGVSRITDAIFTDRFKHVPELKRLGADIEMADNVAIVRGGVKLTGAVIMSSDLRASASLVLAGLAAEGETEILRIYHIDRGYEAIEKKLKSLGASIKRVKTEMF